MNSSLKAQMCVVQDFKALIFCLGPSLLPRANHWLGSFLIPEGDEDIQLLYINLVKDNLALKRVIDDGSHTSLDALSSAI